MFIVHAKRIHEYKRQLMTILQVIGDYLAIIKDNVKPTVAKTYIFAGKAAPSYNFAKLIIKLINNVADVINHDPRVNDMIKVVFIPDYKVSLAEVLIPAADVSIQSSTAGFEASGTGNMKFALNGALTVGTYDGANIEIREAVGADNFYLFGLREEQIQEMRKNNAYNPRTCYENSEYLRRILNAVNSNMFCEKDYVLLFKVIYEELLNRDYYFLLADLEAFNKALHDAEKDYTNPQKWAKKPLSTWLKSAISPATAPLWNMPKHLAYQTRGLNRRNIMKTPSEEGVFCLFIPIIIIVIIKVAIRTTSGLFAFHSAFGNKTFFVGAKVMVIRSQIRQINFLNTVILQKFRYRTEVLAGFSDNFREDFRLAFFPVFLRIGNKFIVKFVGKFPFLARQ